MKKTSKQEAEETTNKFFKQLKTKSPREVKKIKKLAMRHSIKLKEKRRLFCKKCFVPYNQPKIRIKKGMKLITCDNCGCMSRWKLNSS